MSERIHVVQMIYDFHVEKGGGGVSRCAIDLALALDPTQFQSSIFSLGYRGTEDEQRWLKYLAARNIQTITATQWVEQRPYYSFLKAYRFLKSKFDNHTVDIVHSHSEFTDIAAILLKMRQKVPIVLRTTHYGYAIEWRNKPIRRAIFSNFLYPLLFDLEIGVNPSLQQRLNQRRMSFLSGKKALYINEAVQLERFQKVQIRQAIKKQSLGIPENAQLVGCIGRLAEQKGYIYLLQAAAQVIHSNPDVFFLIIGDGPLAEELKLQAHCLGIQNRLIFAGSRTDIEELLACMDVFALASLWEGMPISVIESMASRTPVIATDIPGTRDLIQHGENGWLVPPADPAALSRAILHLLATPSLRDALTKKALSTVREYSIHMVAGRYESIYRSLCHTH